MTVGDNFPLRWDCRRNPPSTQVSVRIQSPVGAVTSWPSVPHAGTADVTAVESGTYTITVTASLGVNGRVRSTSTDVFVAVA